MIDSVPPPDPTTPSLTRAFAACIASALEMSADQFPLFPLELPAAVGRWRNWLAGRDRGLVAIAEPGKFSWPGYWIAVLDPSGGASGESAVLMFGTPSGVVLSPDDDALVGRAAADLPVRQGFVLAGFDPALSKRTGLPSLEGRVEMLAVATEATGPMRLVESAQASAGRGLEGDRYAARVGTFTPRSGPSVGYDLTLIQAEVLDELLAGQEQRLGYAEARRNLVTRGIDLNGLVGRRFRVGEVECFGQRLCEPCAHLERLTTKGVLRGLIHRGGLRADIVSDGVIAVGSSIETLD